MSTDPGEASQEAAGKDVPDKAPEATDNVTPAKDLAPSEPVPGDHGPPALPTLAYQHPPPPGHYYPYQPRSYAPPGEPAAATAAYPPPYGSPPPYAAPYPAAAPYYPYMQPAPYAMYPPPYQSPLYAAAPPPPPHYGYPHDPNVAAPPGAPPPPPELAPYGPGAPYAAAPPPGVPSSGTNNHESHGYAAQALTEGGVQEEGTVGAGIRTAGATDMATSDPEEDRRARKNAQSRARAAKLRNRMAEIQAKPEAQRTEEEKKLLKNFTDRRTKKNDRSRDRATEKKTEVDRILTKSENERSRIETQFLEMAMDARKRKNEGDRLRRKRLKELGLNQKSVPFPVPARGPVVLPPQYQQMVGQQHEMEAAQQAHYGTYAMKPAPHPPETMLTSPVPPSAAYPYSSPPGGMGLQNGTHPGAASRTPSAGSKEGAASAFQRYEGSVEKSANV